MNYMSYTNTQCIFKFMTRKINTCRTYFLLRYILTLVFASTFVLALKQRSIFWDRIASLQRGIPSLRQNKGSLVLQQTNFPLHRKNDGIIFRSHPYNLQSQSKILKFKQQRSKLLTLISNVNSNGKPSSFFSVLS